MKPIRCALYDRVSTDLQVQTGISLETQLSDLSEYATSHGYEIVGCYSDEGITARKKMQNRKDFMRLLEDVKQDKIDLILVTKLDRWFRNVRDYHNTQAILEAHNCNWKTIYEDYDTSTADGQLKINIMLAVAQNECDRTSERIKAVFAYKVRNKEHLNGKPGYGYVAVDKKLQKDPEKSHIVDEIFRYYFTCYSKRKTVYHILNTFDDPALTEYRINYILGNELYAGIRYGIEGYCPSYITPDQHRLIKNVSSSRTYAGKNEPYLFGQLMKCPHCGANMVGFYKSHKLKDGGTNKYKRYRCSKKYPDRSHPVGACISESVIEEYMLERVYPELQDKIYRINKAAAQKAAVKDETPQIRAELNRLNLLFQKGRISENYYEEQYSILESRLKLEAQKNMAVPVENYKALQKTFSGNWKKLYQELDCEHKSRFWKSTIREIYIDKDTHKICGFDFLI